MVPGVEGRAAQAPARWLGAQTWPCSSVWGENRPATSPSRSSPRAPIWFSPTDLGYGLYRDLGNEVGDLGGVGEGKVSPLNIKERLQNGNR